METENVRKQLKISQNVWRMLWCIENANINKDQSCTKNLKK